MKNHCKMNKNTSYHSGSVGYIDTKPISYSKASQSYSVPVQKTVVHKYTPPQTTIVVKGSSSALMKATIEKTKMTTVKNEMRLLKSGAPKSTTTVNHKETVKMTFDGFGYYC